MKKYSFIALAAVVVLAGCGAQDTRTNSVIETGKVMEAETKEVMQKTGGALEAQQVPAIAEAESTQDIDALADFEATLDAEFAELENADF